MVSFIHKYLNEHRTFYQTYRALQGEKLPPATFAFDDSPFPAGFSRKEAHRETFGTMSRNFDLSLRFFTFLECESKRVPGHDESLVERFLRQSFAEFSPVRASAPDLFPGNGWTVRGLRLEDFGLARETLKGRFLSATAALDHLSDLHVLMTQGMVAVWCPQCRETHIQGVPQAWVFYNRHYHPSGNCVGSLVDVPHLENARSLIREGFPFTDAADLDRRLSTSKKNLTWMGNLSGTLSNADAFDSGPFAGEGLMVQSGRVVREPEGHVHKHYLLRREHLSPGARFEEERLVFQRAHSEIYQTFANLHSLFNAAWLYPFSLFKAFKDFSIDVPPVLGICTKIILYLSHHTIYYIIIYFLIIIKN
jgi:hypothetical protein